MTTIPNADIDSRFDAASNKLNACFETIKAQLTIRFQAVADRITSKQLADCNVVNSLFGCADYIVLLDNQPCVSTNSLDLGDIKDCLAIQTALIELGFELDYVDKVVINYYGHCETAELGGNDKPDWIDWAIDVVKNAPASSYLNKAAPVLPTN